MRRVPVVLLLASLALAGCAAPEAEPAADDVDVNATGPDVEAPVDDGTRPMATDVGHMPHMHDYWEGKERVILFDDAIDASSSQDLFGMWVGAREGRVGAMPWRLPDGATVMEGTGQMDLTATWEDPSVTSLAVSYRVGPGAEWSAPQPLANGELVSLAITPAMTDMPHMSTSRWEFLFTPADSPGSIIGTFELRIEIVKMRDIMLFPGHPELFDGKPEKVLHDRDHEHSEQSYVARVPNILLQGEFGEKTVAPDELVPMETKAMRVEVTIASASSTPGQVAEIRFFYRGADTSYMGHPTVLPMEGSLEQKFLAYQFPVEMEQTDSPYLNESQWLFFVEPAVRFVGAEQEPTMGGMTDVSIEYRLKVIAYDHDLDEYSKMEGDE